MVIFLPFRLVAQNILSHLLTTIYTILYFVKPKNGVFSKFKHYKTLVENQLNQSIKIPRSINGGDNDSQECNHFCDSHGLSHQFTIPYGGIHGWGTTFGCLTV